MVQFGHYLDHLRTRKPEWAPYHMNYGNLKRIIRRMRELAGVAAEADSDEESAFVTYNERDDMMYSHRDQPQTVAEAQEYFQQALDYEVQKAGTFHRKLLEHFQTLGGQTDEYWSADQGSSPESRTGILQHNIKFWTNKSTCEWLYREICALKHFSATHRIGIRKIIKKYNKALSKMGYPKEACLDLGEYHRKYNQTAEDAAGRGFSSVLLESIETTYAEYHSCEDIDDAKRKLLSKHEHQPLDLFVVGILLGILVPVVIILITLYVRDPNAVSLTSETSTFWTIFPIYRMLLLINAWMWAWGVDLLLFDRLYLNHTYLFGLNPDTQLRWSGMINVAAVFTLINAINLAFHFIFQNSTHIHFTVLVLLVFLLCFFAPVPVLYWSTRKAFIRTLWKCILLPIELPYRWLFARDTLTTIPFRDFFLTDQMTSAAILIGDIYYAGCFTLSGGWIGSYNTVEEEVSVANTCLAEGNLFKPLFVVWPFVWRFCQCLVMLFVTENRAHLANGLKYFICIIVVIIGSSASVYPEDKNLWVAWVAVTAVAQFYSWTWDFMMDWGWKLFDWSTLCDELLRRPVARREELSTLLPKDVPKFRTRRRHLPWAVYIIAVPIDLMARFLFFTTVDEGLSPYMPDPRILSLGLGVVEVSRRCMWNILRIENEQLHNLESYRPKSDEVPEPLNKVFGEEWHKHTHAPVYSAHDEESGVHHRRRADSILT